MTELKFVNKPYNNHYHEWGKNCATLEFNEHQACNAFDAFGEVSQENRDMFWEGYTDGPRPNGEIWSINLTFSN